MKISVIIPSYNSGNKIKNLINLSYIQDNKNIEVIVIDDGSTDGSDRIIEEYFEAIKNVKLYRLDHGGVSAARNYAISKASGDYIYFADADDKIKNNFFDQIIELIEKHNNPDLLVFGYEQFNGKKSHIKTFIEKDFSGFDVRNNYENHFDTRSMFAIQGALWNKLFKRELIVENNILFLKLQRYEDEGFIATFVDKANTISFIENIFYEYYVTDFKKMKVKYNESYSCNKNIFNYLNNLYSNWNSENQKLLQSYRALFLYGVIKDCDHFSKDDVLKALAENIDEYKKVDLNQNDFPKAKNKQIDNVFNAYLKKKYRKVERIFKFRRFLEKYFSKLLFLVKTKGM